jgi:hypothetical protein
MISVHPFLGLRTKAGDRTPSHVQKDSLMEGKRFVV